MREKDLKIGNYVCNGFGKVIQILNNISFHNTSGYEIKTLKPILLDVDWLLKFGFIETEKMTYEKTQIGNDIDLTVQLREYHLCVTLWQDDPVYLTYYYGEYFVHNLQNLFYALTGEELELNHESKP